MLASLRNGEVVVLSEQLSLSPRVTPNDIAAFVGLKIPWGNKDHVSLSNPNPSFHFASDSTEAFVAVLAFHQNSVKA